MDIAALGVKQVRSNVDIALVSADPRSASVKWPVPYGHFLNPYSRLVAEQLAVAVQDQTRWRKLFDIPISLYGGVSAYLNLSRQVIKPPFQKLVKGITLAVRLHSVERL